MNIFNPSIMVDMGVGHITPNYEYGLQKGLGGIKTHVRQCREKLGTPTDIAGVRSLEFYDAELIVLDAISALSGDTRPLPRSRPTCIPASRPRTSCCT